MAKKDKDKELALRDRKLLDAAANGWSGEEIEAKYGIPAATALVRIREILKSRDIFSDIEKKQLLLYSAYKLKEQIEDQGLELDNVKSVEAYLKVLRSLGDMLERQGKITEEELQAAARAQAVQMLGLIEAAYGRVRGWLAEEYPDVPIEIADARFHEALREVATEDDE